MRELPLLGLGLRKGVRLGGARVGAEGGRVGVGPFCL